MHVLQVTSVYYPELQFGGPPQKIHALSHGLSERGHQIQVVTLHSAQPAAHHCTVLDNVTVQYLPWRGRSPWQMPLGLGVLAAAIRQADIVHAYGLYNMLCPVAAWLAKQIGRPFLLEPQGMYTPRARRQILKRIYHHVFTNRMMNNATRVVATSPGEAEELAHQLAPDRLVVRLNGIELTQFQKLPVPELFRVRYNLTNNEKIVLFLGRISPIKNLEQLIAAFHEAKVANTRLVLAGPILEDTYAKRLHTQISQLGMTNQVLLIGPLYGEEKLAALAATDLFVLPSLFESYGNAAAEAVAAGVPVLLTETCGIAPRIHGHAGLAVPPNQSALADGLRTMLNDDTQRAALTRSQASIIETLAWEEPLKQTELMYQDIIHRFRSGMDTSSTHTLA